MLNIQETAITTFTFNKDCLAIKSVVNSFQDCITCSSLFENKFVEEQPVSWEGEDTEGRNSFQWFNSSRREKRAPRFVAFQVCDFTNWRIE